MLFHLWSETHGIIIVDPSKVVEAPPQAGVTVTAQKESNKGGMIAGNKIIIIN